MAAVAKKTTKSRTQISANLVNERTFKIKVKVEATGEIFPVADATNSLTIRELKSKAEFATGIPAHLQRMKYLDEGDLLDHTDLKFNDVVPGALMKLSVWPMWRSLIQAVASDDFEWAAKLGATTESRYSTPNLDFMTDKDKCNAISERAFTALFIAAHRGNQKMVLNLLEAGANVNGNTKLGRSPLHVAAAKGHGKIMNILLDNGADVNAKDFEGKNALAIADAYGNRSTSQNLFMFEWQQRAKKVESIKEHEMWAHQYYDSSKTVWLNGKHQQMYLLKFMKPGEFEGTSFNAPKNCHSSTGKQKWWQQPEGISNTSFKAPDIEVITDIEQQAQERASAMSVKQYPSGLSSITEEERSQISSNMMSACKTAASQRPRMRPPTYDEWLHGKKNIEQGFINEKKNVKARTQMEEDNRKFQEDMKDKSYEQWLSEKEASNKKPVTGKTKVSPRGTTANRDSTKDILKKFMERRDEQWEEKSHEELYMDLMKNGREGLEAWLKRV